VLHHPPRRIAGIILGLVAAATTAAPASAALPPFDTLVPDTTKLYVGCANIKALEDSVGTTKLGGLFKDPALKPFIEDVRKQIEDRLKETEAVAGLRFSDMKGLSDGQLALAIAAVTPAKTGTVVLVDVTGQVKQLGTVQQKIAASLQQRNAAAKPYESGPVKGTHYVVPPPNPKLPQIEVVEALINIGTDSLWIVGDCKEVVDAVVGLAGGGRNLTSVPAYKTTMDRTKPAAGEPESNLRAFLEPIELMAAVRNYEFPKKKHKPDPIEVFRKSGLGGLQGIGAQLTSKVGDYGIVLRAHILAPPPLEKALKMLAPLPGDDFSPQPWVADDVVGYGTVYWDLMTGFNNFGSIFGGFLEEDEAIFWEVIRSLKEDPDGPQIDLVNEFFALLGNRVSAVVDLKMPIAADSSEVLFAVNLKQGANEEETKAIAGRVAATIKKAFANDPSAERVEIEGLEAWKLTFKEDVAPAAALNDPNVVNGQRIIATALVTVWNGHLIIAGDPAILKKVITLGPAQPGLAVAADYVAVTGELVKLIPDQIPTPAALAFLRLDEFIRVDYELARAGKLKEGRTILGRVLDAVLRDQETGAPVELKINGAKLPPFAAVQKHFSPFGMLVSTVPDGMFLVGFTYEKSPPGPVRPVGAAAAPATPTPTPGK
jgi:hypothetical protein